MSWHGMHTRTPNVPYTIATHYQVRRCFLEHRLASGHLSVGASNDRGKVDGFLRLLASCRDLGGEGGLVRCLAGSSCATLLLLCSNLPVLAGRWVCMGGKCMRSIATPGITIFEEESGNCTYVLICMYSFIVS